MAKFLFYLFKTARPRQWLKNLAVFAAIIFTGQLFNPQLLVITIFTFLAFCTASSANYFFNDVLDAPADRKHPFKKNRPVASGVISSQMALLTALSLIFVSLLLASFIGLGFFLIILIFLLLEFSYSLFLKKLTVIDILSITAAYILRVYGGEVATGFHISIWLFLAVLSLSLFLAIGKRRAELTLIEGLHGIVQNTRDTLSHYSERLLDTYIAMTASSTWITYAFYTFLERPPFGGWFWQSQWGRFFSPLPDRKWLMLTIPFVLFGMMRYMQLIYESHQGESPERILTSDVPLMITVLGWGLTVILIIYGFGG